MHYDYKKLAACSALLLFCASAANAKYCVKIPTCEDLGYIYEGSAYPNSRTLKCPFDENRVMLLDYCQAYSYTGTGISAQMQVRGEIEECTVTKAGNPKAVATGYYRFTRCNEGYYYKSGDCIRLHTNSLINGNNASCKDYLYDGSPAGRYCTCNEGYRLISQQCIP